MLTAHRLKELGGASAVLMKQEVTEDTLCARLIELDPESRVQTERTGHVPRCGRRVAVNGRLRNVIDYMNAGKSGLPNPVSRSGNSRKRT